MQATRESRLAAKVRAVNRAHEYANKLYPWLVEKFAPLVGQKILKQDGSLLAKYADLVPELPSTHNLHVYRHHSDYSLAWTVKTSEPESGDGSGPHTVLYYEVTFYVGDLRGQTLEKLTVHQFTARTDYTAAEVAGKREAYEKAKQAADDARSALYPFGEYDR